MSVAAPRRLVFCYSYGMGGWGDLLKGLHTCWCWAKATDRELHIDFGQHVFGDIFPAYKMEYTYDRKLSFIDAVGKVSVEQIAALEDSTIGIYCNWFSPLSVKGIPPSVILGFLTPYIETSSLSPPRVSQVIHMMYFTAEWVINTLMKPMLARVIIEWGL